MSHCSVAPVIRQTAAGLCQYGIGWFAAGVGCVIVSSFQRCCVLRLKVINLSDFDASIYTTNRLIIKFICIMHGCFVRFISNISMMIVLSHFSDAGDCAVGSSAAVHTEAYLSGDCLGYEKYQCSNSGEWLFWLQHRIISSNSYGTEISREG